MGWQLNPSISNVDICYQTIDLQNTLDRRYNPSPRSVKECHVLGKNTRLQVNSHYQLAALSTDTYKARNGDYEIHVVSVTSQLSTCYH